MIKLFQWRRTGDLPVSVSLLFTSQLLINHLRSSAFIFILQVQLLEIDSSDRVVPTSSHKNQQNHGYRHERQIGRRFRQHHRHNCSIYWSELLRA